MREVLGHFRDRIEASDILERLGLTAGGYFLVSAHREENVDNPDRLTSLLSCLERVHRVHDLPIVVSTHPRTRKRLEALGQTVDGDVRWLEPFGFHDYNHLQLRASCVLSDSGTIAEESSILGFPAITLRDSIERPEALDTGSIIMTGLAREDVTQAIEVVVRDQSAGRHVPVDYAIDNCSERAVRFILSTARRHHQWSGIRSPKNV